MRTFVAVAIELLRAEGRPMHYKEITDIAAQRGLLERGGPRAQMIMGARLSIAANSTGSDIQRVVRGVFALSAWDEATKKGRRRPPPEKAFVEAAREVLRTAKRPMHYKEITDIAAQRGLLKEPGPHPEATMAASLTHAARAERPELVKFGKSTFVLSAWVATLCGRARWRLPQSTDAEPLAASGTP
jgi:hypothetical protein